MNKSEFEKYNTPFQLMIREKYVDKIKDNPKTPEEVAEFDNFFWILGAPEQYENEEEMAEYLNSHPNATLKELFDYFEKITPIGLPPCASEWEDDEEDE